MIKLDKSVDKDFGHDIKFFFRCGKNSSSREAGERLSKSFADPPTQSSTRQEACSNVRARTIRIGWAPWPATFGLLTVSDITFQPIEQ
jgi:hypothetical protein